MDFYVAVSIVSYISSWAFIRSSDTNIWRQSEELLKTMEKENGSSPFRSRATHDNNRSLCNKEAIEAKVKIEKTAYKNKSILVIPMR